MNSARLALMEDLHAFHLHVFIRDFNLNVISVMLTVVMKMIHQYSFGFLHVELTTSLAVSCSETRGGKISDKCVSYLKF